jgi:hypothetical protein
VIADCTVDSCVLTFTPRLTSLEMPVETSVPWLSIDDVPVSMTVIWLRAVEAPVETTVAMLVPDETAVETAVIARLDRGHADRRRRQRRRGQEPDAVLGRDLRRSRAVVAFD